MVSYDRADEEQQKKEKRKSNTKKKRSGGFQPTAALVMGCFGRNASGKSDAEESKRRKEANKKINQQIQKDKQVYRATHRLLLLGILSLYIHFNYDLILIIFNRSR